MRRCVLFLPALLAAACLPGERPGDAGDGGIGGELDGSADSGPPYTGDARNDLRIFDAILVDVPDFDAPAGDAPDMDAAGSDAGGAGSSACPTASAPAGGQTVLIGWSYGAQGLIAMRADGSVVPVAPLGSSTSLAHDGDLTLWSAQTPYDPNANGTYDAVLVDRGANVRWRFTREMAPLDTGSTLFVDGRTGAAALGFSIARTAALVGPDEGVAILPDGTVYELPGVTPNGPPRLDGWIPWSTTTPDVVGHQYGFINAVTGEKVSLHMPVLGTSGAFARDGVYVYRSWSPDDGQAVLVVDDPAGATVYPTPIGSVADIDKRIGLSFTTDGPLVTVDGRPRWLLRNTNDLVDLGPLPGDDGTVVGAVVGTGDRVLVFQSSVPRWVLLLSTATFVALPAFPTPAPAPAMTTTGTGAIQVNDRWAAGTDGFGRFWRLDLVSGAGEYLDPAPLRQILDGCGRHPAELLSDGTVAAGLRDDAAAWAVVRGPADSDWHRVGRPLTSVSGVLLHSVGALLGVEGTGTTIYCPHTPETWSPLPAGGDMPLQGNSSQIVALPGPAAAFVNTGSISARPGNPTIHPSGGCGLWNDQVHNVVTGETFAFPSTYAVWW